MPKLLLIIATVLAVFLLLDLCIGCLLRFMPHRWVLTGTVSYHAEMMPLSKWGFSYFPDHKCDMSTARIGCIGVVSYANPRAVSGCF